MQQLWIFGLAWDDPLILELTLKCKSFVWKFLVHYNNNVVRVSQLIAKTRAAPLKRVTLPRLELCAAHLLAQLVNYCLVPVDSCSHARLVNVWCDSIIPLLWIQIPPYRLKTYIANRVGKIQELTSP